MTSDKSSRPGKTDLSIIIISYNTKEITLNCLNSIYTSLKDIDRFNFEIIVIDNNSTDDSVKTIKNLQKSHNNLVLIENKENTGFAKANNQGVQRSHGEYILLLNSDTIVLNHAIAKLLEFMKENSENVHFTGGKLIEKDGKTAQPSCGPFYSLPVVFGALFLRGDYWGLTRSSPDYIKEIDWVSGACILTKKEYYERIDGFDEKIFMYMDEIDLLYRAKQKGYRTFFFPDSRFIHLGSASSGGKTYPILQVYKGFGYFYRKHHSPLDIFLLKVMLKLKALIALVIGKITNNRYLIQTYEQAYKLASLV